jgi:hypothetical protein
MKLFKKIKIQSINLFLIKISRNTKLKNGGKDVKATIYNFNRKVTKPNNA